MSADIVGLPTNRIRPIEVKSEPARVLILPIVRREAPYDPRAALVVDEKSLRED